MVSRKLVKTVSFPARSRPHMLRVSPDGKEVWVQTAEANTNVLLDASDLSVLATPLTGQPPGAQARSPRPSALATNPRPRRGPRIHPPPSSRTGRTLSRRSSPHEPPWKGSA